MSSSRTGSRTTMADLDRTALDDAAAKLQRILKDVKAFDVRTLKDRGDERMEAMQKRVNNLLADLLGMGSPDYAKHKLKPISAELDTTFGDHYSLDEYRDAAKKGLANAAASLEATIAAMRTALAGDGPRTSAPAAAAAPKPTPSAVPAPAVPTPTPTPTPQPPASPTPAPTRAPAAEPTPKPASAPTPAPHQQAPRTTPAPTPMKTQDASAAASTSGRILVLGDSDAGASAAELLAQLGMDIAVIDSPTIERLDAARDASYAVIASTDGGDATLLAIGFLLAIVGRSRIALLSDDVPAALSGCVQVKMDEDGLWRLLLAREMKKAGLEVDLNRAL